MTNQELIMRLRRLKVETGSLACLGCGHGHNCATSGCAIMRAAADQLEKSMDRCARYAEEIAVLQERQKWIPVTERLPRNYEPVMVIASGKPRKNIQLISAVELATFCDDGWCLETYPEWMDANVTHWMPLPKAPEVE